MPSQKTGQKTWGIFNPSLKQKRLEPLILAVKLAFRNLLTSEIHLHF